MSKSALGAFVAAIKLTSFNYKAFHSTQDVVVNVHSEHLLEEREFVIRDKMAEAQVFARTLCQTRANIASTTWMEAQVRDLVANHPNEAGRKRVKEIRVLQFDDLKKEGMGLFVGVGQGAEHLPRCVIVHY